MTINPSNDGKNPDVFDEKRRVKIFLVEEGSQQVEVSAEFDLESNRGPKFSIVENRMEIGFGEYSKQSDGSIHLKLTLIGDCTMSSNNISGMTQLQCFIPASLRKE